MPRLPDYKDLRKRPVPIPLAELPGASRAALASARARLLQADVALRRELEQDNDHPTWNTRYGEAMQAARAEAEALIANPADRERFAKTAELDLQRGAGEVRRAADRRSLAADLASLHETAQAAPDEATRIAAINTVAERIAGAQANGNLDPERAAALRREWVEGYLARRNKAMGWGEEGDRYSSQRHGTLAGQEAESIDPKSSYFELQPDPTSGTKHSGGLDPNSLDGLGRMAPEITDPKKDRSVAIGRHLIESAQGSGRPAEPKDVRKDAIVEPSNPFDVMNFGLRTGSPVMPVAQRLKALTDRFFELGPKEGRAWTVNDRASLHRRMGQLRQAIDRDPILKQQYIAELRQSVRRNRAKLVGFELDITFLEESEGARVPFGYPVLSNGRPVESSGVTTATGFDIGTKAYNDLNGSELPKLLIATVSPYAASGYRKYFKGKGGAYAFLKSHPLGEGTIDFDPFRYRVTNFDNSLMPAEISALDAASLADRADAAAKAYDGARDRKNVAFQDLPEAQQTVLVDLAFRGDTGYARMAGQHGWSYLATELRNQSAKPGDRWSRRADKIDPPKPRKP